MNASLPPPIRIGEHWLDFNQPVIMGVININNDSFYSGSRAFETQQVVSRIVEMDTSGASIIDLGVMSSRPGAEISAPEVEIERLIPVLKAIPRSVKAFISIDTIHSKVASAAINGGAHIINDISGGNFDKNMLKTVAELEVPFVLMHMRGTPESMNQKTNYPRGVTAHVLAEIMDQLRDAQRMGIKDVIVDPGFGFSKNVAQNFTLLRELAAFKILGRPILAGLSRKSMIWRTLDTTPDEAKNGTTMLNAIALNNGANILRVHDVKEAEEVRKLWNAYCTTNRLDSSNEEVRYS